MKSKTLILFLCFTASFICYGQANFSNPFFETNKDIITDVTEQEIALGNDIVIFDTIRTRPQIYLYDNGNSYSAQKLSVVPPQSFTQWKPYLQNPTATSIVISWKSEVAGTPSVDYGTDSLVLSQTQSGTCNLISDNTGSINYNMVTLENLTPNTKYYYTIDNDETIYHFHTQPEIGSTENLRILVLGDHQIINRSGYEWLTQAAKATIEKKYGPMEDHIDLIINPGDQVDRGTCNYYERCHFYKSSYFSPYIPISTTIGNHEIYDDPDYAHYKSFFDYENLSYQNIESGSELYYAFQTGRTLLIFLCTEEAYANDTQLNWLSQIVDAATLDPTVDFIISIGHRPACSETYVTDYSSWLKNKAMPILGASPKHILNIAAHHHYYQRGQHLDYPFYHIISGGASWDQTWGESPTKEDNDLVQKTLDYWTYQIINLNPQTKEMEVETYSIGNKNLVHNNILVDRFTRNLSDNSQPQKPELDDINTLTEFPAVITSSAYQSTTGNDFNSSQFQISLSPDFTTTVLDRTLHFENLFEDSGAPLYLPIDTQKDKSCFELPLNETDLSTGRYYARVRYRNQNLVWSDWSDTKEFIVLYEDKSPSIDLDYSMYSVSEKIRVTYKNAPIGTGAWIGIYKQDVNPGGPIASTKWASTTGADGYIDFSNTPVGKFYMVLFGTSGYDMITPKIEFEVIDRTVASIETDKSVYSEKEPITVTYQNAPGNDKDWIGIYQQSDTQKPGVGSYATSAYLYLPTGSTEGEMTFANSALDKLKEGYYFIGLFLKDGYNECARRAHIVVGDAPQLETTKNTYTQDENIEFLMNKIPPFPKVWLYITNKENSNVSEKIAINTSVSNSVLFHKLPVGSYIAEIRFDDSENAASNPIEFNVAVLSAIESVTKPAWNVYPNPAENLVNITCDEEITTVGIYTTSGFFIGEQNIVNRQIDMTALEPGSYLLSLKGENRSYQIVVLKK